MLVTVDITSQTEIIALERAMKVFNASNPPLSHNQFLERLVRGQLSNLVASYCVTEMDSTQWQNQRFTAAEREAIRQEANANGAVKELLETVLSQPNKKVCFTDPQVIELLNMLVNLGKLERRRPAEILAV